MVIDVLKYMTNMSNRKKGMRKGGNLRQKSRKPAVVRSIIPHPPQLKGYEVKHSKTLRFTAGSTFGNAITFQNLLDLILFTTSATAPFDLFYMVRVRGVKVWALPTIGGATTVTVSFDGTTAGSQGDRSVHTDTSMGIEPAFVNAVPKSMSLAAMFQLSSNNQAFALYCPGGAVIDVMLDFVSDVSNNSKAAQNVSVASATGVIAYRGLDGLALASTNFVVPSGVYQI